MATALSLYDISGDLALVVAELEGNGGELTSDIELRLASLGGAFDQKVEHLVLYMRNLEALATAADVEVKRLSDLVRTRRNTASRLKEFVKAQMEIAGRQKVEGQYIVARIQKNARPSIAYTGSLDTLPTEFVKIIRSFNNETAYEVWKAGTALPEGVEVLQGSHLRVS